MSRRFLTSLLIPAVVLVGGVEFIQAQNAASINAPRPSLSRRVVTNPAPGSRFDFEMQKQAMLNGRAPSRTIQAPATPGPLLVPPSPEPVTQPGTPSKAPIAAATPTSPPQVLRAPFITKRGPGAPVTPSQGQPMVAATGRLPVRVPMPEPLHSSSNLSATAQATGRQTVRKIEQAIALKPVNQSASQAAAPRMLSEEIDSYSRPALETQAVTSATPVTIVRSAVPTAVAAAPVAFEAQKQTTVVAKNVATKVNVEQKPLAEPPRLFLPEPATVAIDLSQRHQLHDRADTAIKHVAAVGTIAELAFVEFPETEAAEAPSVPAAPLPASELPEPQTLPAPAPEVEASQPRVLIQEPAKLAIPKLPSLPQPQPQSQAQPQPQAHVKDTKDILISQLESELSELRGERERLQQTASASEQFSAQTSATTTVVQAAEIQSLVARVAATLGDRRTPPQPTEPAATGTVEHRRFAVADICQTAPLPNNFLATGQKLYCKGLIADAEVAFRTASQQADTQYERLLATYLVATCLRRQDRWDEAMQLYSQVASQKAEPTLASLARWQISHSDVRRTQVAAHR